MSVLRTRAEVDQCATWLASGARYRSTASGGQSGVGLPRGSG